MMFVPELIQKMNNQAKEIKSHRIEYIQIRIFLKMLLFVTQALAFMRVFIKLFF